MGRPPPIAPALHDSKPREVALTLTELTQILRRHSAFPVPAPLFLWRGESGGNESRFRSVLALEWIRGVPLGEVSQYIIYSVGFFGPRFFEGYCQRHPIDAGNPLRRTIYHLHTMLIHIWYFGDARYHRRAAQLAEELAGALGVF